MAGEAAQALKTLRERAGLTYRDMAAKLGYGEAFSTYSSYELTRKKPYLPPELVKKLVPVLVGLGEPEITEEEVMALGGLTAKPERAVKKPPSDAGFEFHGSMYGRIAAFNANASAGPGAINVDNPEPEYYHLFPLGWIRGLTHAPLSKLAIINVRGDSMVPTLLNGDQVLIDQTVTSVAGDGFYVLVMGNDLQVKRVSRDLRSKALRVASDNPLAESWTGVSDEDVYILGRVLWLGRAI